MRPRSIRLQLTALFTAILAVTLIVAGVGVHWGIGKSIRDTVDHDLRARLKGMRGYLDKLSQDRESGSVKEELEEQSALVPAGELFRIADRKGEWIYQSQDSRRWGTLAPGSYGIRTIDANGQSMRVLTAPDDLGTIQIGEPLDEFYEMLDGFTWSAWVVSPVLLLLAGLGGYWMSGRALRPVDSITTMANQIGANDLSQRLPLRGVGDELDRLSDTLNAMFGRLEDAFGRITRFTADASHELRTPVAVIRTTAELTRAKPRSQAEYEKALDRILVESERTTSLISDLLYLARSDEEVDDFGRETVDLGPLVLETCRGMEAMAAEKEIQMAVGIREDCPQAQGDAGELRRLLSILLDNAFKFTPRLGTVRVSLAQAAGGGLDLSVADTGPGISPADLPHVFERFYRASKDRSRSDTAGGTGLGLAIAKEIALRHEAKILIESEPGKGASFTLRLPPSAVVQNRSSQLISGKKEHE